MNLQDARCNNKDRDKIVHPETYAATDTKICVNMLKGSGAKLSRNETLARFNKSFRCGFQSVALEN